RQGRPGRGHSYDRARRRHRSKGSPKRRFRPGPAKVTNVRDPCAETHTRTFPLLTSSDPEMSRIRFPPDPLREAEGQSRAGDAAQRQAAQTQAAILNALPAHVALIDPDGVILAVNESWRSAATANLLH